MINFHDLEILWTNSKWNGPLSGLCSYKDKKYYFSLNEEHYVGDCMCIRIFDLYSLPEEKLQTLEADHSLAFGTPCQHQSWFSRLIFGARYEEFLQNDWIVAQAEQEIIND